MVQMISERHNAVLKKIYEKLSKRGIVWAITGSLNFALHGLKVEVHDIDIQTDKKGAYEIEQLFSEFMTKKVTYRRSEHIRSYFGVFILDGITVEIMGQMEKKLRNGRWERSVNVDDHKEIMVHNKMHIPVLSLEYEEKAYRKIGRIEKADLLLRYLKDDVK